MAAHLRALASLERGDLDAAMHHLVEATRVAPDYAPAHVERGLLLDRAGDGDGAARAMGDALARLASFRDDDVVTGPEPLPAKYWSVTARAFLARERAK